MGVAVGEAAPRESTTAAPSRVTQTLAPTSLRSARLRLELVADRKKTRVAMARTFIGTSGDRLGSDG